MPKPLTPQNQWETQFEVPIPGEPRNIGPLEILFQRLLNRTERLKERIGELLGLPWDAALPTTLGELHARVQQIETGPPNIPEGGITTSMIADSAITAPKIANGAITASKLAIGSVPYDIALYRPGRVAGGARLLHLVAPRPITVLADGHRVSCDTPPAAQWQAEIRRNGSAVGTISIPAGQTSGSINLPDPLTLLEGDALTIVAQSSADANLLGVAIVLRGVA